MKIDISSIAKALEKLSVEKFYNWNFPRDDKNGESILKPKDLEKLNKADLFQSNILLKDIIHEQLMDIQGKDQEKLYKIYSWIVKEWGGIKTGNDKKLFEQAEEAIQKDTLSFDRIASTSKILSFYQPSKHIIYDARIIYSLNALMLLESASDKYFPMPAGRNSKMSAFDINVLIRLKHKPKFYKRDNDVNKKLISQADRSLFISKKDAYEKFRETVTYLHWTLYDEQSSKREKLYYTEMLLFAIADTHIYDRILDEIEIKIK